MYFTDRLIDPDTLYTATGTQTSSSSVDFETRGGCRCASCCAAGGTGPTGPLNFGYGPNNGNANDLPSASWEGAAAQLNRSGARWNTVNGQGQTVITYAYRATRGANTASGEITNFQQFSAAQIAATEMALSLWADLANIEFVRVGGNGYSDNAAILFGSYINSGANNSFAFAYLPSSGNETSGSVEGDVWTNRHFTSNGDARLDVGEYGFSTIVHEIGHALGLSHPGEYNAGQGNPSYAGDAEYFEDSIQYSIMSYFSESNTNADYGSFDAPGPQLHDIAAIQSIYGINTDTRTNNNRYGFNSNAGSFFDLNAATDDIVVAIHDGGGFDWLDFSGYSDDAVINLAQESFSSVGGLTMNVSIAQGTEIEAAEGGSGNDTITGNDLNNRFYGNGGNDEITGGLGVDRVYFSGNYNQYTVTRLGGGGFEIAGNPASGDGTDTVFNIRYAHFANQTIDLVRQIAGNVKPVVTEISFDMNIGRQEAVAIAPLFDITDANADTIVLYRFRYSSDAVGTAYLDGNALNAGQWYIVQKDELGLLTFEGNYAGPDTAAAYAGRSQMILRSADGGGGFSNIGRIWLNVADVNEAPIVSSSNPTSEMYGGTSSAILSFFDIESPDGDAITEYQVRDLDAGGAQIRVNGVVVGAGAGWTTVSLADIGNTLIFGNNGANDDIQLRAFDGTDYSTAASVDIYGDFADSAATNGVMSVGQTLEGNLHAVGDADRYAITLEEGKTYVFWQRGLKSGVGTLDDPLLRLFNGASVQLAESDDIDLGVNRESRFSYTVAAGQGGTYYLRAGSWNNGDSGTYQLEVYEISPSAAPAPAASSQIGNWVNSVDVAAMSASGSRFEVKFDETAQAMNRYQGALLASY